MKPRQGREAQRAIERAAANAVLCKLPLTEYLALPRAERKRRVAVAKKEAGRA